MRGKQVLGLRHVFGERHISLVEIHYQPVPPRTLPEVLSLPFLESLSLRECDLCDTDLDALGIACRAFNIDSSADSGDLFR